MIEKSEKICLLIIFFGFCISLLSSINNTKNNDYFFIDQNDEKIHKIIKGDIDHYWSEADIIKKNVERDGSITKMSRPLFRNYLYPKFIASYYLIIGKDIRDINGDYKIANYKVGIPIIQSIFFFLCLLYFIKKIKKKFSNLQMILITLFLSLNPILSQYHSSYWTESFFLSFLLLLFANLIDLPKKNFNFFLIGILIGLMYLQRSPIIFLFVPITIYFFFVFKFNAFKKSLIFILGYFLVLCLIGFESYKRTGTFYFTFFSQSNAHYNYVSHKLNAKKLGVSEKESFSIKEKEKQKFITKNGININDEKDLLKIAKFEKIYFFDSLKGNLIFYGSYHLYKTLQSLVLTSNSVYYIADNKTQFWKTEKFKNKFKRDILISFFFYLICLIGLIQLYFSKNKDFNNIIIFTFLFISYNIATLGWIGVPRYMVGNQILFSIFFCFGIEKIYNYLIKIKF